MAEAKTRRVVSITGEWTKNILSQKRYQLIAAKQADAHELQISLACDVLNVETCLNEGGVEEEGALYYDRETHLIRSKQAKRIARTRPTGK